MASPSNPPPLPIIIFGLPFLFLWLYYYGPSASILLNLPYADQIQLLLPPFPMLGMWMDSYKQEFVHDVVRIRQID